MNKISFVVINRNNEKLINVCLESIAKINYSRKEIILVDDYSTDGSLNNLNVKPNKIIKHDHNKGIAEARNSGIKATTGDLVMIIDSDIEITSIDINEINTLFQKHLKLVAVSGNYYSPNGNDGNLILDARRREIFGKNNKLRIYDLHGKYTTISGGFCVIHKERYEGTKQIGKLLAAGEDILFQVELLNKGFLFGYVPSLSGIHHHTRNLLHTFKKARSEARGNVWATHEIISNNFQTPKFISIFNFPILLLLSLLTGTWPLLCYRFLPQIYLVVSKLEFVYVELLFYDLLMSTFQLYYGVKFLLVGKQSSYKLKYLIVGAKNDIYAPIAWFKSKI